MRATPSLFLLPEYPVAGGLCVLAVLVTAMWWTGNEIDAVVMSETWPSEPWRALFAALPHANLLHIGFNLMATWTLGTLLEEKLGTPLMAGLSLALAFASSLAEFAFFDVGVGLSGIGYGYFGFIWVAGRRGPPDSPLAEALDRPMVITMMAWFFVCIGATVAGTMRIANGAHAGGLVLGAVLGWLYATGPGPRRWAVAGLTVGLMGLLGVGASVARPTVNLVGAPTLAGKQAQRLGFDGWRALRERDPALAAELFEAALARQPDSDLWWFGLGQARQQLGQYTPALDAYREAVRLAPDNPLYRDAGRRLRDWLRQQQNKPDSAPPSSAPPESALPEKLLDRQ